MHIEVPSKGLRPYITSTLMTPSSEYPATMDKLKSLDVFHNLVHYLKDHHMLESKKTPDMDPVLNDAINAMKSAYSSFFAHIAKSTKDHEVKKSYASNMIDQLYDYCVKHNINISRNDMRFKDTVKSLMDSSLCQVENHKHLN